MAMSITVIGIRRTGAGEGWVKGYARRAAKALRLPGAELTIVFTGEKKIAELNYAYRKKRGPTDILSFPAEGPAGLGDVFIAPSFARAKAKKLGLGYREYLAHLIVHGVLHLGGYDHEKPRDALIMEKVEKRLLRK